MAGLDSKFMVDHRLIQLTNDNKIIVKLRMPLANQNGWTEFKDYGRPSAYSIDQ